MAGKAPSRTLSEFASTMGWNWTLGLLQGISQRELANAFSVLPVVFLRSKAAVASSPSTGPMKPRSRWPRLLEAHSSKYRSLPTKGLPTPGNDAWLWTSCRSRKRRRAPSLPTRDHQPLAASNSLKAESAPSGISRMVSQSVRTLSHS